ncbi:hypothetical protein D3C83_178210 [compost metagenome]
MAMGMIERARDLTRDTHCLGHRKLPRLVQPVAQRLALDVRHDVEEHPVCLAGVEQREDVGMAQPRRQLDLAKEPLAA